jgi:hypothetical protein
VVSADEKNIKHYKLSSGDMGDVGDFGESTPTNSFSGGETDHAFISHHGEQFYDLDFLAGLGHPGDGRTNCMLDYDRDGWVDFVVSNANKPTIQLMRNRLGERFHPDLPGAGMIAFRFVGGGSAGRATPPGTHPDGCGAHPWGEVGGKPRQRADRCGDGRAAQNSATWVIGIGHHEEVARRVTVLWPSGKQAELADVSAGSLVTCYENPSQSPSGEAFTIEPYILNVLAGKNLQAAKGERLLLDLPNGDAAPRLHLVTAMFTTCKSCAERMPQVQVLRNSFQPADVRVWGVSTKLEETSDQLRAYVAEHQPAYEVLPDLPLEQRNAVRDLVLKTFRDDLTPVTIALDAGGHVLKVFDGVPSNSDVQKLLNEQ